MTKPILAIMLISYCLLFKHISSLPLLQSFPARREIRTMLNLY